MAPLADVRAYLDAVDPRLWPVILAVLAGGAIWLWRKVHASSFEKLPPRIKMIPAAILAAVVSGVSFQEFDVIKLVIDTVLGGFSGLTAAGGHEFVARLMHGSKEDRVERAKSLRTPPMQDTVVMKFMDHGDVAGQVTVDFAVSAHHKMRAVGNVKLTFVPPSEPVDELHVQLAQSDTGQWEYLLPDGFPLVNVIGAAGDMTWVVLSYDGTALKWVSSSTYPAQQGV